MHKRYAEGMMTIHRRALPSNHRARLTNRVIDNFDLLRRPTSYVSPNKDCAPHARDGVLIIIVVTPLINLRCFITEIVNSIMPSKQLCREKLACSDNYYIQYIYTRRLFATNVHNINHESSFFRSIILVLR